MLLRRAWADWRRIGHDARRIPGERPGRGQKMKCDFKPSPYVLAHERCAGYRGEAYAATAETVREWLHADGCDVRSLELSEIDETALECWEIAWPRFHPGAHYDGNFPWRAIAQQIRPTPRRFDLAIWADFGLCGLCAGMASKNGAHVAINFIERFHGPNPLKGLIVPGCGSRRT
jgi:hypothetical protein